MKRITKRIFILAVFVVLLFTLPLTISAWDYGGDVDWGGDSDIGGDYDWGGGDSDNDWDWDSDSDNGGFLLHIISSDVVVGLAVFVVVVIVLVCAKKVGKKKTGNSHMHMSDTSNVNLHNLALLRESDPEFSEAAMLSMVEHLFVNSQIAYAEQDYEPMRPFLSNALYEQHAKQIEEKKAMGNRNVISEMAVLQSKLENYVQDGHTEYLDVWLRVKYKSYIGKISDPNIVVSGAKTKTFYLDFRWQFTRSAGARTDAATDAVRTGECPNCGAPVNMNQSGKCKYCGSVISTTEYDWVLSKIDALQQRRVG